MECGRYECFYVCKQSTSIFCNHNNIVSQYDSHVDKDGWDQVSSTDIYSTLIRGQEGGGKFQYFTPSGKNNDL